MLKVRITKSSDWTYEELKTFRSYNELFKWLNRIYNRFVITLPREGDTVEVEIYDFYRE